MGSIVRRKRRLKLAVTATLTSCVLYIVVQASFQIFDRHEIHFSDDWIPRRNIKQFGNIHLENKTFAFMIPQTYVKRRNRMIDSCVSLPPKPSMYGEELFRQHLLVDRGRHLVFCGIEKVGLTFWRRFFSILNDAHKSSPFDIRAFDAYIPGTVDTMYNKTMREYNHVMTSSLSVMFSRDPFERIFSAYVDKFVSPNINFWIDKGTGIIRKYRKFPEFSSLRCGNDVTFAEFVKYVVNHAHGQEKVDSHFVTITEHCRPCHIRYDVIGKMATFYNDTMFLIRTVGHTKMRDKLQDQFIDAYVRDQFSHSVDLLFFYKRDLVDRHKCVPSFHTAQQRMWRALQLRGLISLETKYPIKRSERDDISKDQLLQVLFNSLKDRVPRVHKKDAMFEAYASVDFVDLHKLRDVFRSDCDLFDYDCSPSSIFNQSIPRKYPDRFFNFE
ncbi:carbohydrate sulfotransferase 11-like [Mizuhopecten yessoensis]|uniref:Carbohydrate sulfotransferase n=1 Tax=Mizuhopecten yessoensis TaxID=6573 RepID=A0A210QIU9_MIZYE|nr:carbohydrate sulfotransferase 11-like [Mizuhopecten yessoensis]OWF48705.1 Carbohydrate sulfotransferase 11 [Mizuhopecten yessoensis]